MITADETQSATLKGLLTTKDSVPPSLAEILASPDSPRILLDPEFEPPFEQALAKTEEDAIYFGFKRGSQKWLSSLDHWYRRLSHKYWLEERPVIAFVEATPEQLREWVESAFGSFAYTEPDKLIKEAYGTPALEHLEEVWCQANKEAAKGVTTKKSERDSNRIYFFKKLISFELRDLKEGLLKAKANAEAQAKKPPKIEIKLPSDWFAEEIDVSARAKSIKETKQKLAPICHYALEEWFPKHFIDVRVGYVLVGTNADGFKVSRTTGGIWWGHFNNRRKPNLDLLICFKGFRESRTIENAGEN